jgi:hypothetical protein
MPNYGSIVRMGEGSDALAALDILKEKGEHGLFEYLKEWEVGDEFIEPDNCAASDIDYIQNNMSATRIVYKNGPYVMCTAYQYIALFKEI